MTRRECGSCRFFEQSGIGESGWCRNQRCKEIVGVSLVRRQELACRIGWDRDFYESASGPADLLPGQNRPAQETMRQRSGYQGTKPDDIIVGIEQPRPVTEAPVIPVARSRTSNVGEAHRRALERQQIARQAGDMVPQRRLESIIPPERSSSPPTERADDRPPRHAPLAGDEGVSRPRLADSPSPPAENPPRSSASNFAAPRGHGASTEHTAPPRTPPPGSHVFTGTPDYQQPPPPPAETPAHAAETTSLQVVPRGGQVEPLEADWYAAERQRHRGKRCANCRDFQVAESGDRGWCRNRFAFPTPQLVGPNDLACLSCIGTWWAANDQWWLAKAAMPQRMATTPLADALLEEMQAEEKRRGTARRPGAS